MQICNRFSLILKFPAGVSCAEEEMPQRAVTHHIIKKLYHVSFKRKIFRARPLRDLGAVADTDIKTLRSNILIDIVQIKYQLNVFIKYL